MLRKRCPLTAVALPGPAAPSGDRMPASAMVAQHSAVVRCGINVYENRQFRLRNRPAPPPASRVAQSRPPTYQGLVTLTLIRPRSSLYANRTSNRAKNQRTGWASHFSRLQRGSIRTTYQNLISDTHPGPARPTVAGCPGPALIRRAEPGGTGSPVHGGNAQNKPPLAPTSAHHRQAGIARGTPGAICASLPDAPDRGSTAGRSPRPAR